MPSRAEPSRVYWACYVKLLQKQVSHSFIYVVDFFESSSLVCASDSQSTLCLLTFPCPLFVSTRSIPCQPGRFRVNQVDSVSTRSIPCQPGQFRVNQADSVSTRSIPCQAGRFRVKKFPLVRAIFLFPLVRTNYWAEAFYAIPFEIPACWGALHYSKEFQHTVEVLKSTFPFGNPTS
jgi:hypothetical protein